jgi:hypothetical protein
MLFGGAYFITLVLQVLVNIIAFGPLKIFAWILRPLCEVVNAINIAFVTILPLYHATSEDNLKNTWAALQADATKLKGQLESKTPTSPDP